MAPRQLAAGSGQCCCPIRAYREKSAPRVPPISSPVSVSISQSRADGRRKWRSTRAGVVNASVTTSQPASSLLRFVPGFKPRMGERGAVLTTGRRTGGFGGVSPRRSGRAAGVLGADYVRVVEMPRLGGGGRRGGKWVNGSNGTAWQLPRGWMQERVLDRWMARSLCVIIMEPWDQLSRDRSMAREKSVWIACCGGCEGCGNKRKHQEFGV